MYLLKCMAYHVASFVIFDRDHVGMMAKVSDPDEFDD